MTAAPSGMVEPGASATLLPPPRMSSRSVTPVSVITTPSGAHSKTYERASSTARVRRSPWPLPAPTVAHPPADVGAANIRTNAATAQIAFALMIIPHRNRLKLPRLTRPCQFQNLAPLVVAHRRNRQPRLADEFHLGELGLGLDFRQRH